MREMMHRYFKPVGSVGISDVDAIEIFIVIRTDEVPFEDLREQGFVAIDDRLGDEEVKKRYRVEVIYEVTDERQEKAVN